MRRLEAEGVQRPAATANASRELAHGRDWVASRKKKRGIEGAKGRDTQVGLINITTIIVAMARKKRPVLGEDSGDSGSEEAAQKAPVMADASRIAHQAINRVSRRYLPARLARARLLTSLRPFPHRRLPQRSRISPCLALYGWTGFEGKVDNNILIALGVILDYARAIAAAKNKRLEEVLPLAQMEANMAGSTRY